jgi:hypothetical protein
LTGKVGVKTLVHFLLPYFWASKEQETDWVWNRRRQKMPDWRKRGSLVLLLDPSL